MSIQPDFEQINREGVVLHEDVVSDVIEKIENDLVETEVFKENEVKESSEDVSFHHGNARHKDIVKNKAFIKRALEKEISLKGVEPESLAKQPQLLNKYNRKVKKIEQQQKKDTNKQQRFESKLIEKNIVEY